VIIHCTL